jgi:hypothetical protein
VNAKKKSSVEYLKIAALAFLILLPSIFFILLLLQSSHDLYGNKYQRLSSRIDELYNNGWPVEYIRSEFHQDFPSSSFTQYALSSFSRKNLSSYESEIEYLIGVEFEEALGKIGAFNSKSSKFYIEEIAQPTDNLELLVSLAYEGIEVENYDLLSFSLYEISNEIEVLDSRQQSDIAGRTQHNMEAIESLAFFAPYYYLDFADEHAEAIEISEKKSLIFERYLQIKEVKRELASKLDEMITQRGGWGTDGKRIFISIGRQSLYMIDDYEIVQEMPASTGIRGHGTAAGEFQVYEKVPMAWGYYRIWMPNWLTIYYSGGLENGIHGIPVSPTSGRWSHWDSVVGVYPITYGCVMPHDWDAKILYDWAEIGIPVSIVY